MLSKRAYQQNYISQADYNKKHIDTGTPYTGFVIGLGYAWVQDKVLFPTSNNPQGKRFYDAPAQLLKLQHLDDSLYMKELSLNFTLQDLEKLLYKDNGDGTVQIQHERGGSHFYENYSKKNVRVELTDTGSAVWVKYTYGEYGQLIDCRLSDFIDKFCMKCMAIAICCPKQALCSR